jgi:hypothetical protein
MILNYPILVYIGKYSRCQPFFCFSGWFFAADRFLCIKNRLPIKGGAGWMCGFDHSAVVVVVMEMPVSLL